MKLKQRFMAVMAILIMSLLLSIGLNIMTYVYQSRLSQTDFNQHVLNRELNSVESESSKGSNNYALRLVQALEGLQDKPVPLIRNGDSGALFQHENMTYQEIARKLLQDKSFNTDKTIQRFFAIAKELELIVKPAANKKNVSGSHDSQKEPDVFKSTNNKHKRRILTKPPTIKEEGLPENFPTFHLPHKVSHVLLQYVNSKLNEHNAFKRRLPKPKTFKIHKSGTLASWQKWHNSINQYELYNEKDNTLNELLHDLSNAPINGMSTIPDHGSQIKVIFKLENGSQALFKPMRIQRNEERNPNHFYFDDFERHHAEIGAFHLDKVMQFHRVPPNAGRWINITSTIEKYGSKSFKETIFISPAGNKCFYGKCDDYCDSGHAVCGTRTKGRPDQVEGAMAAWLPFGKGTRKTSWLNPWRRSYTFSKADWETDYDYCYTIKKTPPYNAGRRLLDLMDITIFDYLTGNQDRYDYHTFKIFGNHTSPLLYDNGRGFGWMTYDDPSIIVPVVQCCQIRYSTLRKLLQYETSSKKLSDRLRRSLLRDPLSSGPNGLILSEGHLKAIDRRVSKVLDIIWNCVNDINYDDVIIDDGF